MFLYLKYINRKKLFDRTVNTEGLRNHFVVYWIIFPKRIPKVQIGTPTYF